MIREISPSPLDFLAHIDSYLCHTWKKAHVAAGGPFCSVRRRPKFFLAFLHSFVRRRPNFWEFLHNFARRRLKNWISVGDRITELFPC